MLSAMTLSCAIVESDLNWLWSSWWLLIQVHLTEMGSRLSLARMSQRRLKSGCCGLRGDVPDADSIADLPSRPMVMLPCCI